MMKRKKGGRPLKYANENPSRITISIRPRYKEMLQAIANIRGCTVSEAVELVTADYCLNYKPKYSEKSLYEMIAPNDSIEELLKKASDSAQLNNKKLVEELSDFIKKYRKLPSFSKNIFSYYEYSIKSEFKPKELSAYFYLPLLDYAIKEAWRRGYTSEQVTIHIKEIYEA